MISYKPLWHLLIERDKDKKYLIEVVGIHSTTIQRMNKGESVSVTTLEKICLHFDCNIEDICAIKKDPSI